MSDIEDIAAAIGKDDDHISEVDRKVLDAEADEIGGMVNFALGNQGAGKTLALVNKAIIDLKENRIVYWRGQESCQWIVLAANDLPVTLWLHESIQSIEFYTTGDIQSGIEKKVIDVEDNDELDVEIRRFEDPDELVEDPATDRINVYYIPGSKSTVEKDRYFSYKMHKDFWAALNNRSWGNHVSYLMDEAPDIIPPEKQQPFYSLLVFQMPKEMGNFRKNNVSYLGNGHHTSEIFHKFWNVKANTILYFQGAKVKSRHSEIDQQIVNNLNRGSFVVPGFQKASFELPSLPHDTISWLPDVKEVKFRASMDHDVPDLRPTDSTLQKRIKESPLDEDDVDDMIGTDEAAELLDCTPRTVQRKIADDEIPAIELNGKYVLARKQVLQTA